MKHFALQILVGIVGFMGLPSCEVFFKKPEREFMYYQRFEKDSENEHLIFFGKRYRDTLLLNTKTLQRSGGLAGNERLGKDKRHVKRMILVNNLELIDLNYDSVGIYNTSNDSLVAMMYSRAIEEMGKLRSSTKYTNPFVYYDWRVDYDEKEHKRTAKRVYIGTVTYILKKLE